VKIRAARAARAATVEGVQRGSSAGRSLAKLRRYRLGESLFKVDLGDDEGAYGAAAFAILPQKYLHLEV
jgi:hypothetical protein